MKPLPLACATPGILPTPIRFRRVSRRGREWGRAGCIATFLLALAALGLAVRAGDGAGQGARAGAEPEWGRQVPRVFLKGDQARLYFLQGKEHALLKGGWKRPRVPAQGFHTHFVALESDASPPPLPKPQQKWRELKVLPFAEWRPFARSALEGLVPTEAGRGLYIQYAAGEVVLFRDVGGKFQAVPLDAAPMGMVADRRLGPSETAAAVASAVETNLVAAYPEDEVVVLAPPPEARPLRWVVFDRAERRVMVLLAPPAGTSAPRGSKISSLASFVLVDQVWALVKNPVSSLTRTLNQGLQWTAALFDPRLREGKAAPPAITGEQPMDLALWERWLDQHTDTPRERGSVRLLINGEAFFPVFERRVAEAQREVHVHVCIFDRDDVGVRMADLLKERSTNVTVKVVFDRLNSRAAGSAPPSMPMAAGFVPPRSIGAYLRSGSRVQVRPLLNPGFTADHTKVFIVDGRYAYLGGMNLGREYRYEWHDLMVEVEGPVVASLQRQFDKKWAQAGVWGDCALAAESLCGNAGPGSEPGPDHIELRRLSTKTFDRQIRRAELEAVRRARRYVYVENAYLYDNSMVVALTEARRRGVDVRVVIPGQNDLGAGQRSNLVLANHLLSHGVRVFFYPGMSHVKAMLADGWVCFGSANFDALSLRLNREANLASSDPGLAARFERDLFEADFAKSREMKEPLSLGWADHLAESVLDYF